MVPPILSICIPVYNRIALFRQTLKCAIEAVRGYENEVEIVVSDNFSTDPIFEVVQHLTGANPGVAIRYSFLPENRGGPANVLEVVKQASGEFCWVVGSDDFVLAAGVKDLISIIRNNPEVDFISVGCGRIDLKVCNLGMMAELPIADYLQNAGMLKPRGPRISSKIVPWEKLLDPKYYNCLLTPVMASVFRRKIWLSVNTEVINTRGPFTNIQNAFPHCYVFARAFFGRNAWYHGRACIVIGDGAREWAAENGEPVWESSLPVIYLKVYDEIVDEYNMAGLDCMQVRRCRKWVGTVVGRWVVLYLIYRYLLGKSFQQQEYIDLSKIAKTHWNNIGFYEGIARLVGGGCIRGVKRLMLKAIKLTKGCARL